MVTRLFEARFNGRCDANGCDIEAGEMIGYADGYDKPLCKQCWKEETEPPKPTCSRCFTVHAGECL